MALASGTAHRHVGKLTSSPVFQRVGDVHSGTLRTVGDHGVRVRKLVAADLVWPMCSAPPSGVRATSDRASGSTELTTARCEVTQALPCPGARVMTLSPAR
jgi:hypothetical protein